MPVDYDDGENFFEFSNSTRPTLVWLLADAESLVSLLAPFSYIFALIGMISNAFNVIVLCQKAMRISSINTLLVALSISDVLFLVFPVQQKIQKVVKSFESCKPPNSFLVEYTNNLLIDIRSGTDRSSTWLGLSIALIRTLVMRNPLRSDALSSPKVGVAVSLFVFAIASLFTLFEHFWLELVEDGVWKAKKHPSCESVFPSNYTQPYYTWQPSSWVGSNSIMMHDMLSSVLSYLLPCLLFPVCSVFLVHDIRKANRGAAKLMRSERREGGEKTSKLVALLTVTFVLTTFPSGIMDSFQWTNPDEASVANLGSYVAELVFMLKMVTSTIHVIICFSMSTLYRQTAIGLFRSEKQATIRPVNTITISPRRE